MHNSYSHLKHLLVDVIILIKAAMTCSMHYKRLYGQFQVGFKQSAIYQAFFFFHKHVSRLQYVLIKISVE